MVQGMNRATKMIIEDYLQKDKISTMIFLIITKSHLVTISSIKRVWNTNA